jgi:UPF0755 protein
MEPTITTNQAFGLRTYFLRILVIIALILFGFLIYINDPPTAFPKDSIVVVNSGDNISTIASELKNKNIIRSTLFFKIMVVVSGSEQKIVAGDYYLSDALSVKDIISRLSKGDFDLAPVKMTISEGLTMEETAKVLSSKLPHFSVDEFMQYSPEKEGYLFPDTYFFAANTKAQDAIALMQKNFENKIKTFEAEILAFGKSENDIVTMASILEEEAQTEVDWQIISGILWKRMKIGMPLQVDCTLGYVTGRASLQLTKADLKINSPYNTYTNKGLPPTAISNPGLLTLRAALTPTETPYLYYLSDKKGVIHYAATFAEHIKNREKYLQ